MNKDKTPKNDKGQRHGLWEVYWFTSKLCYKCVYLNGNENGFEQLYWGEKLTAKRYHL